MSSYICMKGYELITVLLPSGLITGIVAKRRGVSALPPIAFTVYIFAVFTLTGAGTLYDFLRMGMEIGRHNFIPFADSIYNEAYRLNVLLFLPLGFLLPLIWSKTDHMHTALLFGLGLSLLIEISQMFNFRATDVDDLIMNSLGSLLGYLLYRAFAAITHRKPLYAEHRGYAPMVFIAVCFLGRFLLFNEYGLAKLLYGF